MKDSRIAIFRGALDALLDSLDALVRIERWTGPETVPEPLAESARQLAARLGTANRLAAGRFSGSIADAARVTTIADAVRRLDAAYVTYCRVRVGRSQERDLAVQALDAELVGVRAAV